MKKLKLNLDGKEMLNKDQMKKITGGYTTTCRIECSYSGAYWDVAFERDMDGDCPGDDSACAYSNYPEGARVISCECWYS